MRRGKSELHRAGCFRERRGAVSKAYNCHSDPDFFLMNRERNQDRLYFIPHDDKKDGF